MAPASLQMAMRSPMGAAGFRATRTEAPGPICVALAEVPLARVLNAQNIVPQQQMKRCYSFSPPTTAPPSPALTARPLSAVGHMPISFTSGNGNGRKIRVLCYGDSLTVGWYLQGRQYEPYGRSLAEHLGEVLSACEVTVCGHSGHTAEQMVANADKLAVEDVGGRLGKGLRRCLDEAVHRPDLVLIMAGTNDLGRHADPSRVLEDLVKLHGICHSRGVPTVAIAPPQAPRAPKGSAFEVSRSRLQSILSHWVHGAAGAAAFVDPAELVPAVAGGACWDPDGLHLSPAGQRLLGKRLSTILSPLLLRLARARGDCVA